MNTNEIRNSLRSLDEQLVMLHLDGKENPVLLNSIKQLSGVIGLILDRVDGIEKHNGAAVRHEVQSF